LVRLTPLNYNHVINIIKWQDDFEVEL
jgi:hypothetical protein